MPKLLVLASFAFFGGSARALDLAFDKAVKIEFDRCEPILPIKQITEFALFSDLGFLSEAQIVEATDQAFAERFKKLVEVVTPFLTSLDERGEVMDLTGKDALTTGCAKYAKGVLITPYLKVFAEMMMHAFGPKKKN